MFCTKCGYNVGESNFCPKCGNPVKQPSQAETVMPQTPVQPVMEQVTPVVEEVVTPVMPQAPVQPVMEQVAPEAQQPQATMQQLNDANLTWNNQSQQMWNAYQPEVKKKSKKPIIIGVVAALVVALVCVGVFLIMPMLKKKKQDEEVANVNLSGAAVLKTVTAELKSSTSTLASNIKLTKVGSKQKATGHMTINKINIDGEDYMSYVNVDTVNYTIEMDADTGNMYINISLAKGASGTPAVSMQIYTDGTTMYIKVPELFSQSLKSTIEVETDEDFDDMVKMFANVDEETIKQYAKAIETVIGHAISGLDYVIDKAEYTKNEGTVTVSAGDLGEDSFESFNVTINKTDIIDGFNKTIDAIFDDGTIAPYITMLSTVGGTIDKETIKSDFADGLGDTAVYKFTMFTKDDKFAGIRIEAKDYDPEEEGTIDIVTVGGNSLYFGMVVKDEFMKITYDGRNDVQKIALNFDAEDVYATLDYQWKQTETSMEIVNLELIIKTDENSVALGCSTKDEISSITGLSVSAASFPNAIDMATATEEQQMSVASEVQVNIWNVVTKVFSDKVLGDLGELMEPDATPDAA